MASLSKDFHDAQLQMTVRDRNENLSFAFRVNILCGGNKRERAQLPEDKYWYPWRAEGDLR